MVLLEFKVGAVKNAYTQPPTFVCLDPKKGQRVCRLYINTAYISGNGIAIQSVALEVCILANISMLKHNVKLCSIHILCIRVLRIV